MKINKISILLPMGILNALEAYESKSMEPDIKKLESIFEMHELDQTPYEIGVEWPTEGVERILVSDLIIKAYIAGIEKGKEKAVSVLSTALSNQKTELPDDCKVANKEHCFLSGKCKQCEFTVPQ
jgi:hypothetical protein